MSQRQIEGWTEICVRWARSGLPTDHPRYLRRVNQSRDRAHNARNHLRTRNAYDEAAILATAEGGVDLDAVRAENARKAAEQAAEAHRQFRTRALLALAQKASIDKIEAAIAALE